jgi:nucleoside-diphosphate-sugar epimerase
MRVLITGHRGFMGSHLWRECARRGYELVGVDLDIDGGSWLRPGLELATDCRAFFAGRSFASVRRTFDLVFHCAATVGGRQTIDGDPLAVATNLSLDAEMFNWAMRARPGRVVYFSSSAAYPVYRQMERGLAGNWRRLAEGMIDPTWETIGRPDQTYGWAKLTGEMLAQRVNDAGIPVHVFRPFSGYGTDQSPDYPFRAFLDRARRREDPFAVWGDGQQTRDFIHIDDIVGAVFAAIEQDVRGPVNLCTGVPTSFTELATMVTKAAGNAPAFEYLTDKPVGVQYRVGDPSLMRTFYEPKVSLEQGIRMALNAEVAA